MTDTPKIVKRCRGGRGLKAAYPTTTVRVPEVLKQAIQDIVYKFYDTDNNIDNSVPSSDESRAAKKLIELENYISVFKDNNKVTKAKLKLHELVTGLEGIINAD